MSESILRDKSYSFAIRIVNLATYLKENHQDWVLSQQVLKSGTAIGAFIREAEFAQSKADFISKMSIALKEANETEYWLNLLKDTSHLPTKLYKSLQIDCQELIAMLVSSVKTAKKSIK